MASKEEVMARYGENQMPVAAAHPKEPGQTRENQDGGCYDRNPLIKQGNKGMKPCFQEIPTPSSDYSTAPS